MPLRRERDPRAERVLILAPVGRDAETLRRVLDDAGIAAETCRDLGALCRGIEERGAAVLLAEEALGPADVRALNAALGTQPAWSDLPIVLVTGPGDHHEARLRTVKLLEPAGNVTILERPFHRLTLITTFEAALRARRRQYQMRDALAELVRVEQERARAEALRRSEARYRALARNYPNGVVLLFDPELRCTLAEGQGLADAGVSREAVEGRSLQEVLPRDLFARIEPGCRAALAGKASADEVSWEGRTHFVHYVPVPGEGGEVETAMMVTQDVTDQKRAEEELRRDIVYRERFVAVLAHDLRTPLQAVGFGAHMLTKGSPSPAKLREGLSRILRAAQRMDRMIRDLLDVTRSRQGGEIPIEPKPADLAGVCRGVVEEIQTAHPGRRITVTRRGDVRGTWDADRLAQVVSNLLNNAVSYSPPDTPVDLVLRGEDEAVVLEVKNQGDPIPPDAQATLFDPFRRGAARGDGQQAHQGLGLGLFIAERIVHAHGGTIQVTSTAGEGTTFTVTFPRHPAPAPEHRRSEAAAVIPGLNGAAALAPEAGGCDQPEAPHGHRVLVVEDDEMIRDSLRELLESAGWAVSTAADGREALEALANGLRPCLVLLDLMLPVMNGWQVLEALDQDEALADLPVVVVSAVDGACEGLRGVHACLPKPIQVDRLLAAVHQHCA